MKGDIVAGRLDRDLCRVELLDCGDGFRGEYDSKDPEDVRVFRLMIYRFGGNMWDVVGNAGTQLPLDSNFDVQEKALRLVMNKVHSSVKQSQDIEELLGELSWISPDWVEENVFSA